MNETATTYEVPAFNIDKLQGFIAEINKKVARAQKRNLIIEKVVISVGPAYAKTIKGKGESGEWTEREVAFHQVTLVSPKAPKAEGWEFVAALTHVEDVGAVLRKVPGAQVAEGEFAAYRNAKAINCDHCGVKNSRRTETFIVRDANTHALKQVGRNCLSTYTGLKNPEWLCQAAEYLMAAEDALRGAGEEDEGGWSFGASRRGYDSISAFMPFVVASVRLQGWCSAGKAYAQGGESTVSHAMNHGMYPGLNDKRAFCSCEDDRAEAQKCLDYLDAKFSAEDFSVNSDYESNLRVAMLGGLLMPKLAGIIASAYPYYLREMEREIRRAAWARISETSKHIGAEGERITFRNAQVMGYRAIQKQGYGPNDSMVTHLYTFVVDGSVVKWFASNDLGVKLGDIVSFKATVKRHSEWKGVKETQVNRAARVVKATVTAGPEVTEREVRSGGHWSSEKPGTWEGEEVKTVQDYTWKLDDNAGHANLLMVSKKPTKKVAALLVVGAEVELNTNWHLEVFGGAINYVGLNKD